MQNERFALLIDSENISAKYMPVILDEVQKYGAITYKRIYGDWTSSHNSKWKDIILKYSITPMQQFCNTSGKNATDSALIIDAMDILYTKQVDGFCIVSSDGDFTRLAGRLRESGMQVIGMGEEKTPRSFCAACSVFINLEFLLEQEIDENSKNTIEKTNVNEEEKNDNPGVTKEEIENTIISIVTENENKGKPTELGQIGQKLLNKYPDFDVRKFGYSLLRIFLKEFQSLELTQTKNTIVVSLRENKNKQEEIYQYIHNLLKQEKTHQIGLGELSNKLHLYDKNFNVKDFGYSTFTKFIQSISKLEIVPDMNGKNKVKLKK